MRRLLRYLTSIALIAVILLLIARLIGSTRPKLELATLTSGTDGVACDRPCVFGVLPGETSFEEAQQILQAHPLTRDAHWYNSLTLQLNDPSAYILFSLTPDNVVDSIVLTDHLYDYQTPASDTLVHSINIGELILAYGTPDVLLRLDSPDFVMGFPSAGIIAALPRPDLDAFVKPDASLSTLMLSPVQTCPNEITIFKAHPWMGFTTMKQYVDDLEQYKLAYRTTGISNSPYAQCEVQNPDRLNCFLC